MTKVASKNKGKEEGQPGPTGILKELIPGYDPMDDSDTVSESIFNDRESDISEKEEESLYMEAEEMWEDWRNRTLVWEQEDENGEYKEYRRTFNTQEEKFTFIKGMKESARYLGKHFIIIQLEA